MKKTLQKTLAVVMVIAMIFSQMAIMSFATESYDEVVLGIVETVSLTEENNSVTVKFTPTESGNYIVESDNGDDVYVNDPIVYIYDSEFTKIAENDDGGRGWNFSCMFYAEVGKIYYIKLTTNNDYDIEYNYSVYKNPIESITAVAQNKLIKDYHGDWETEWDYENECEVEYFRYDPNYADIIFTVTYTDGTVYIGDENEIEYQTGYWPDTYYSQTYDNQWSVGTNECRIAILGVEGICEIEVIENPVESFEVVVNDVLIEHYDGEWTSDYNEETGEWNLEYYAYAISYDETIYTVTYRDGRVFTGKKWDVEEETGYDINWVSRQSYYNQWVVGKNKTTFEFLSVQATCEVEIIETPVESITAVAQKSLIENSNGYWTTDWDEENNCETEEYYYYEVYNADLLYTVTYKDGRVFTGDDWDIYNATGYHIGNYSGQNYDNQWTLGKNTTHFEILGVEGTCEIEIVEYPIASVTAVAQKDLIVHGDGYWNNEYNDETGNWDLEYFEYSISSADILITVTMKDGTVYTGDRWEIEEATGFSTYLYDDQSYYNQWGLGEHEVIFEVDGIECVATINVVESPVASIVAVANRDLIQYADGGWDGTWVDGEFVDEYFEYHIDYADVECTVTYKNGTIYKGDFWEIYEQTGYDIYYSSEQAYDNQWGLGKHTFTATFLGVETEIEVNIVESPVAKVIVDDIKTIEETCGDWSWDSDNNKPVFCYLIEPEFSVILKDGSTLRSENSCVEYNGYTYWLDVEQYYSPHNVGKHALNASVLGFDCIVNFEVLETPIASITITPSRDLFKDVDYCIYHYELLDYNAVIKYKNGLTETVKLDEYLAKNDASAITLSEEDFAFDIGTHTIQFNFMGVSVDVVVNVVENPYESISISGENNLNITFNKKDGTSITAKATDFTETYSYYYDGIILEGVLETDKGNYLIGVDYDVINNDRSKNIKVYLGDFESNTLAKNNFFEVFENFYDALNAISLQLAFSSIYGNEFDGYNSNDKNIDDMVGLSLYMSDYADVCRTYYKGYYCVELEKSLAEKMILEVFGVSNIDVTQATLYDRENDVVYVPIPEGYGDGPRPDYYVTTDIKFTDGQWVCKKALNYYTGKIEITTIVFNEDFTIAEISLDSTEEVKEGWVEENGKWAFYENGIKATNKWLQDSKGWCFVGADGYCVTNSWKADSKGWCYLDANGRMVINNWVLDGGKWYFMDEKGYMVSSQWRKDSKGWCYLEANGAMATNKWVKDSKGWCYVKSDAKRS